MRYLTKLLEMIVAITALLFVLPFAVATVLMILATDPRERRNVRDWFR